MRRLGWILALVVACGEEAPLAPRPIVTPPIAVEPVGTPPVVTPPIVVPEVPPPPAGTVASRGPSERTPASPIEVAAGASFGCAIVGDAHTLECWGGDSVRAEPRGAFRGLVATDRFACALDANDRARCWGELGSGPEWREPPDEPLERLFAARMFVCGQRADGSLACFGDADSGRLEVPSGAFTRVAVHDPASCGLRANGHIECWGLSPMVLDGDGFTDVAVSSGLGCGLRAGEITCAGYRASTVTPTIGPFASFAPTTSIAGGGGICALRPSGEAACFGFDRIAAPPPPPGGGPFGSVAVARTFACGLRTGEMHLVEHPGQLDCWGLDAPTPDGSFASLALGEGWGCALGDRLECFGAFYRGQARPPVGSFTALAAGATHTCAIASDGTLACWGEIAAPPSGTFTALAAGDRRSCAIDAEEHLQCWGIPLAVGPASPPTGRVRAVAMTAFVECAVLASGSVECWGPNTSSLDLSDIRGATSVSLGSASLHVGGSHAACFSYELVPTGGMPNAEWHAVECPALGATVRASNDSLVGLDGEGVAHRARLGTGLGHPPIETIDGDPFTAIAASDGHGCSIRTDGELRCWGADTFGQSSPPSGHFTAVSAGGVHTCGLRDDGTIACWGGYAGTPL